MLDRPGGGRRCIVPQRSRHVRIDLTARAKRFGRLHLGGDAGCDLKLNVDRMLDHVGRSGANAGAELAEHRIQFEPVRRPDAQLVRVRVVGDRPQGLDPGDVLLWSEFALQHSGAVLPDFDHVLASTPPGGRPSCEWQVRLVFFSDDPEKFLANERR